MTEEIYELAADLVKPSEAEKALLRLLCRGAEQSLERQAGERLAECREAFLCAAAFLAAAGLLDSGGGGAGTVEKFSVGDVSVSTGSSGGGSGGDRLRQAAERLMAPLLRRRWIRLFGGAGMIEAFMRILAVYGQAVSSAESGECWRAFVQPVRTDRSEEERQATALGDVDQRRWLYIGPRDRELRREEVILCGGTAYRVRESAAVPFGEETLYCRAVLRLEKEAVI